MSEQRTYRQFTPEQKTEIVLAGLRGDRSVGDVCRKYQIAETLYYQWRERLPDGGKTALANPRDKTPEQAEIEQLRRRVGGARAGLGPQDLRAGWWRGTLAGLGGEVRVARSRAVVAAGYQPAVVARVAGISRQAMYRRRSRRPRAAGPGRAGPDDQVVVEVAGADPTDGTRMVAALASRELGRPVNRKRVQRVMRAHRLLPAVAFWRASPAAWVLCALPGRMRCGIWT